MAPALLLPLALLLNGLVAGMLLWSVIGGVPWMRRLDGPDYVRLHRFWSPRFDPLGPICVAGAAAADLALLIGVGGQRPATTWPFLLGAVALGGTMVVSATRNAPLKRSVLRLDPDRLPDDFDRRDIRASWARWNAVRSGFALAGFAANVTGVGVLLW